MLQILSKNCLHTLRRAHFTSPVSFISIWPLKVCHFALYKQKGLMGHPVFSTLSSLVKARSKLVDSRKRWHRSGAAPCSAPRERHWLDPYMLWYCEPHQTTKEQTVLYWQYADKYLPLFFSWTWTKCVRMLQTCVKLYPICQTEQLLCELRDGRDIVATAAPPTKPMRKRYVWSSGGGSCREGLLRGEKTK